MGSFTSKKRVIISPLLLMGMTQCVIAEEHHHEHDHHTSVVEAHVHGEAKLNIVIDGQKVIAEFISPLENLVGFEHEPQTTEQKQAYSQLQSTLADYSVIFEIANAKCTQTHQEATSPFNKQNSHHVEWHAEYHLHCTGEGGYSLRPSLFSHYPGVEKLIVQSITDHAQAEYHLKEGDDELVLQ